jgi:acyl-CoA thioester hydrolase
MGNGLSEEPTAGTLQGTLHRLPVRVYYADTDVSGIVHHTNYLRFMERGRSDWMRLLGFDQRSFLESSGPDMFFFAVRSMSVEFLKPALLDDALVVETQLTELAGASCTLGQKILRGAETLMTGQVRAAFLGQGGRPRRLPAEMKAKFAGLVPATMSL